MKRLYLIGAVSYCVFLLVFAPAQLMSVALKKMSSDWLSLAKTQGSFWQGSANILLSNASNKADLVDIGRVSWDIQPLQLFVGKLSISLTLNQGAPFWVTLDRSRLNIEHAKFMMTTEIISALVPSLKVAQLGGRLTVDCDNFSLTRNQALGQFNINWSEASSLLSTVNPLGNYHANIVGEGSSVALMLTTHSKGPLIMQGSGRWVKNEGLHFEGIAEADTLSKLQLQELLRVMGNETIVGSGKYLLRF